ncbi:hypothetical protein [Streptomyces acidiscabies]|uniref:Uncharacterized protein n=1 Tax=Streptomyces acidiscabies TaxID=42234 RepID=A0AAP6BE23_9ACTN|nr:hypothetical protein [Streptomyces acidiscabies]MBP5939610.1 hypothetical protein [Streptomyces sp. LBUM 1476]MBZ3910775.1 hypothetical protein [Streptomyces acidiscabies]MDX2963042.1 hypothetical protein [Streptomyces acidiscabies]MDX3017412.1 hypothetical protein [Streptomyces acidiscabies]MDX3787888.1 hypothetical protein [Streptomyces acidiscabies]
MNRATSTLLSFSAALISIGVTVAPASAADSSRIGPVHVSRGSGEEIILFDKGSEFRSESGSASGEVGFRGGSFTWVADFQIGFESRHYTAVDAGTHRIQINGISNTSGSPSAGCGSSQEVQVTLHSEDFPGDDSHGMKTLPCSGGTVSWTGRPADTYYFYVRVTGNWDSDDLTSRRATGTTSYP